MLFGVRSIVQFAVLVVALLAAPIAIEPRVGDFAAAVIVRATVRQSESTAALQQRAAGIARRLGSPAVVFVAADRCGPIEPGYMAVACTPLGQDLVIYLNPDAFRYTSLPLEQIMAHEIVHSRTSTSESDRLHAIAVKEGWTINVPGEDAGDETVADCGTPILLARAGYPKTLAQPGSYVPVCTAEQARVAEAMLDDKRF